MSRVSLIEKLYVKTKSALEFNFDALRGPTVMSLFSPQDIDALYAIATSVRYSGNIDKKYEMIDAIMKRRGFYKAHCGTNRAVYNCYEDKSFVVKVALDKVALRDSPAEYFNQQKLKPFCCKVFDVHPSGVISTIERVNPITSLEEFYSVAPDIFNMMITKIIGKYVVDDLGADKYMNYGLRQNSNGCTFGPVILDFPYVYELDGGKLICQKPINTPAGMIPCMGEIDYDDSLSKLRCCKCGRTYKAMDLENKNGKNVLIMYGNDGKGGSKMRARIVNRKTGKVIKDTGITSRTTMSKEEFDKLPVIDNSNDNVRVVAKKNFKKYPPLKKAKEEYYTQLQVDFYNKMEEKRFSEPEPERRTVIRVKNTNEPSKAELISESTDGAEKHRVIASGTVREMRDMKFLLENSHYGMGTEITDEILEETQKLTEVVDISEEVVVNEQAAEEETANDAGQETAEAVQKTDKTDDEIDETVVDELSTDADEEESDVSGIPEWARDALRIADEEVHEEEEMTSDEQAAEEETVNDETETSDKAWEDDAANIKLVSTGSEESDDVESGSGANDINETEMVYKGRQDAEDDIGSGNGGLSGDAQTAQTEDTGSDETVTVINEQQDLWQGYDKQSYLEASGKNQRANRRKSKKKYSKHGSKKNKGFDDWDDDDIDNY